MKESLINICLMLEPCDCNHLFKWLTSRHITCTQPSLIIPVHSEFFIWTSWMVPITLSSHLVFIYTLSCLHMNLQVANFQRCECASTQTSLDAVFRRVDRIQQGTRTCTINIKYDWHCSLPSVSYFWRSFSSIDSHLLSLFQSVTSCLFTRCRPRYASCCTVLLDLSKNCVLLD